MALERIWDEVYCDFHGGIHAAHDDPFGYGDALRGITPECGPENWRVIWIGRYVREDEIIYEYEPVSDS